MIGFSTVFGTERVQQVTSNTLHSLNLNVLPVIIGHEFHAKEYIFSNGFSPLEFSLLGDDLDSQTQSFFPNLSRSLLTAAV